MVLTIGAFRLTFPDDLTFETYECADYDGVIFTVDGVRYDIVNNKTLGHRLLISEGLGHLRDLPLHEKTVSFMPDVIQVEKLCTHRLVVWMTAFHPVGAGSIPAGCAECPGS